MPLTGPAAVATAAALDRLLGEPPAALHPVAGLGRLVAPLDREWRRPTLVGVVAAVAYPLLAAAFGFVAVAAAARLHPSVAAAAAGLVLFSTTSLRRLVETADAVIEATVTDLDAARRDLRALAGRDATSLSAGEVRSAAVESAAENLADGLVAPLAAFAVLAPIGLPAAAAAATGVKAVNTLDSMLGYRSKPVGRPIARLDDAAMWVPARLSALLVAVAAGDVPALACARESARRPASPNSGWPMATLAAALSVRLEKPDHYVLDGGRALPSAAAADRGVGVVRRAGWLAFALAGAVAWL